MRRFIINLLLGPDEQVVYKSSLKFERYNSQSVSQLLLDVNRKLIAHRKYCSINRLDYSKIESEHSQ